MSYARVYSRVSQVDFIKNCGNDSQCDSNLLVRGILQLDRFACVVIFSCSFHRKDVGLFTDTSERIRFLHFSFLSLFHFSRCWFRAVD